MEPSLARHLSPFYPKHPAYPCKFRRPTGMRRMAQDKVAKFRVNMRV